MSEQAVSDGGDEQRGGGDPLLAIDADPVAVLGRRPLHDDISRVVYTEVVPEMKAGIITNGN